MIAGPARAQAVGYQLNRFEPPPAGDPFLVVEYPWYSSTRWFAGGLTLDYAHDLIVARHVDASGRLVADPAPIAHQLDGHLDLAGSLFDRVALTLSVPLVLYEQGTALSGIGPSGTVAGDPRLGARVRLFGQPDTAVSLSFSAYLWIPIGEQSNLSGDAGVRVMPRLTVGGLALGHLRWAANASFLYRETARLSNQISPVGNTVGSEVQLAAGLSYVGLARRLSVGPEAILSLAVASDLPPTQGIATLELFAGAHYLIADQVQVGLGAGVAVVGSPGPPDFRLLCSFAWAPLRKHHAQGSLQAVKQPAGPVAAPALPARALPIADSDGDGVPDASDACPDRKGVASPDSVRNGCPSTREKVVLVPDADGHVGAVEVDDGHHKVLLDQAYASTEVGEDGTVQPVPPTKAEAVERSIAALARTMAALHPVPDRDHDGIGDARDACPDRPGVASTDPFRDGCPKASERVMVVPDTDGHVGGVEVNDGKSVTVLDRAYATAEVGEDGRARRVPSPPVDAVERSIAQLAGALPPSDRDGDGVDDAHDACPDRSGPASADPAHNGCPLAVEKVVVLPDADGHVGAVEVDDGRTKTLLDQAYATAEVGADGRARKLESTPAEVGQKFGPAMAAQPEGARIILYFNQRAEPVRDLTGPITTIVAELKGRTNYRVEVIGHTDQTGSERANRRIGLQRARVIAARLIAAGVPKNRVRAISKGSSEPAVIVQDRRVAEPRNRRVEVWVRDLGAK